MLQLTYVNIKGGYIMSIDYAILGILSYKSMTGYDIKKIIQDSAFMPWSGNNNQIYKSLTELLDKGLVTNVVKHQESFPTKKIYSITGEGLNILKEWVLSSPEPCEIKKPFLVQLAWSKQLNTDELNMLIDGYENQIKIQLLMAQRKEQDISFLDHKTAMETTIWNLINENILRTYENELGWIQALRSAIANIPNENDMVDSSNIKISKQVKKTSEVLKYILSCSNGINYVYINDSQAKLETEKNILDIITVLAENNTQFVLFDSDSLLENFINLKKELLGALLQKFTMYNIKTAIVIKDMNSLKRKFRDLIAESEKNEVVRLFTNVADAEAWFLSLSKRRNNI